MPSRAGVVSRSRRGSRRWRPCWTWSVRARRSSRRGTPTTARVMQLADLEARGRLTARLVDITDTDAVTTACEDAALVWLESPTNPALELADIETIARVAHERRRIRRRRQHLRHSPASATADHGRRHRRALGDEVPLRPRRRDARRAGHRRRPAVRRTEGTARPGRRDPRHARGLARAARSAHPAPAGRPGREQRPRPRRPPARPPRGRGGALPRLRRDRLDRARRRPGRGRPGRAVDVTVGARHLAWAAWSRRSNGDAVGSPSRPPSRTRWCV